MRLSYILLATAVLAINDWDKKQALQVVEERARREATKQWKASAKSFDSNQKSKGEAQMQAGLEASSTSQTLQKTVGRPGTTRPDMQMVVKLPAKSDIPKLLPQIGRYPQNRPHPNKAVHERKIRDAQFESAIHRDFNMKQGRTSYYHDRFATMADLDFVGLQYPDSTFRGRQINGYIPFGGVGKAAFAERITPQNNEWTVKGRGSAKESWKASLRR